VTRGELFAVAAGVIGFAADVLTIVDHVHGPAEHASTADSLHWPVLMAVTTIYGWLIFAWFLTRWRFLKDRELKSIERALNRSKRKPNFLMTAFRSVLTIGIVISPLVMYIGYSISAAIKLSDDYFPQIFSSLCVGAFVGLAIFCAVYQGMPLIYDEIQ
jgi:hypothetical protein